MADSIPQPPSSVSNGSPNPQFLLSGPISTHLSRHATRSHLGKSSFQSPIIHIDLVLSKVSHSLSGSQTEVTQSLRTQFMIKKENKVILGILRREKPNRRRLKKKVTRFHRNDSEGRCHSQGLTPSGPRVAQLPTRSYIPRAPHKC